MIIERGGASLLKLAVGGMALAATALLVRRLLKRRQTATITRPEMPPRQTVMNQADEEVPWGVGV